MITTTIKGVEPSAIDSKILAAIADEPFNPFGSSDRPIGVLNEQGQLYRVILCDGPNPASRVVDALTKLGLIDRVHYDDWRCIDSITKQPLRTAFTAVFQTGTTAHALPRLPTFAELFPDE